MHDAGKRSTCSLDRYNPSRSYPSPILPATDFDLTMPVNEDVDNSLSNATPLSLELSQRISDMAESFSAQLDHVARKFTELYTQMDEFCGRIDDNDIDTRTNSSHNSRPLLMILISIQNDLSQQKLRVQEFQKSVTNTHHTVNDTIKSLDDRISLVEGQDSRLAALENKTQKFISTSFHTTVPFSIPSTPQVSFQNILTSTTMSNSFPTQFSVPHNTSCFSAPQFNNTIPKNVISTHNSTTLSNIFGINFDSTTLHLQWYFVPNPF